MKEIYILCNSCNVGFNFSLLNKALHYKSVCTMSLTWVRVKQGGGSKLVRQKSGQTLQTSLYLPPTGLHNFITYYSVWACVAQWIECRAHDLKVVGSSPAVTSVLCP